MTPIALAEKVLLKVDMGGPCWIWRGKVGRDGYGMVCLEPNADGPSYQVAHRFLYELLVAPVPADRQLDHLCHGEDETCPGGWPCQHRACVRPSHLEVVSAFENSARARARTSAVDPRTHCRSGHEFTVENTYIRVGGRDCRRCIADRARRYMARKRETA